MTAQADATQPHVPSCPICGKPRTPAHRPFCSPRCRDIDLGRWLKDSYRVETDEGPESDTNEEH